MPRLRPEWSGSLAGTRRSYGSSKWTTYTLADVSRWSALGPPSGLSRPIHAVINWLTLSLTKYLLSAQSWEHSPMKCPALGPHFPPHLFLCKQTSTAWRNERIFRQCPCLLLKTSFGSEVNHLALIEIVSCLDFVSCLLLNTGIFAWVVNGNVALVRDPLSDSRSHNNNTASYECQVWK